MATHDGLRGLPPFDDTGEHVVVVVETPAGSRAKLAYDGERGVFRLAKYLPAGFAFPYDFGFVPGSRAGDGDPLDVLLIGDAPTAAGCVVAARLIGVVEGEQTVGGKVERNDRVIAVPAVARDHAEVKTIDDLGATLVKEIETFLVAYQALDDKAYRVLGHAGPERAVELVDEATRDSAL